MPSEQPANGPRHERPGAIDRELFAEDEVALQAIDSFRRKRRKTEHVQQTAAQKILLDVIARGNDAEDKSPAERIERLESAINGELHRLDRRAIETTVVDSDDERGREVTARLDHNDTRLRILDLVAQAEVERATPGHTTARSDAVEQIAELLAIENAEAERLYKYYADHPEIHLQVIEIERARAVLNHEPERFMEYVELVRRSDQQGIERLFAEIARSDAAFAERTRVVSRSRTIAMQRLHQLTNPGLRVEALLGPSHAVSELAPAQQVALAEALENIDQPVLEAWGQLQFTAGSGGLSAAWLGGKLELALTADGYSDVRLHGTPVRGGTGQDFFESAVIGRLRDSGGDDPGLTGWHALVDVVGAIGPGFHTPVGNQVDEAVMLMRQLQLENGDARKRYGVIRDGKVDGVRCQLLGRQVGIILDGGRDSIRRFCSHRPWRSLRIIGTVLMARRQYFRWRASSNLPGFRYGTPQRTNLSSKVSPGNSPAFWLQKARSSDAKRYYAVIIACARRRARVRCPCVSN